MIRDRNWRCVNDRDDAWVLCSYFFEENMQCPELIFVCRWVLDGVAILVIAIVLDLIRFLSVDDVNEILADAHVILATFAECAFLMHVPCTCEESVTHFLILCHVEYLSVDLFALQTFHVVTCEFN